MTQELYEVDYSVVEMELEAQGITSPGLVEAVWKRRNGLKEDDFQDRRGPAITETRDARDVLKAAEEDRQAEDQFALPGKSTGVHASGREADPEAGGKPP
jgi:hypothetical protein